MYSVHMKAAVLSDMHDNYHNLTLVLLQLRKYKIEKIHYNITKSQDEGKGKGKEERER